MNAATKLAEKRDALCRELRAQRDPQERLAYLVACARKRVALPDDRKTDAYRVEGCLSKIWIVPRFEDGKCFFETDSDSLVVKAVAGLLCDFYSGQAPQEIMSVDPSFLVPLGINQHLSPNRRNALARVWDTVRRFAEGHLQSVPR